MADTSNKTNATNNSSVVDSEQKHALLCPVFKK